MNREHLRRGFNVAASRETLVWLVAGWVIYYIFTAIWYNEAYSRFTQSIPESIFKQVYYLLMLASGCLLLAKHLYLARKSYRAWLAAMFWLGCLVLAAGFFLSIMTRQSASQLVSAGSRFQPVNGDGGYVIDTVDLGLKRKLSDVENNALIFSYEPSLTLRHPARGNFRVGSYPPSRLPGSYCHILNCGFAPRIRLTREGQVTADGYMALRIINYGGTDSFEIPNLPYRFTATMKPVKVEHDGEYLIKPYFVVRVFNQDKVVAEGDSRSSLEFDGYSLSMPDYAEWILLQSVSDPGMSWVRLGIYLIVFGIPLLLLNFILFLRELTQA